MNQKIKTKRLISKISVDSVMLPFQSMYDYVCFIAPIDYCVE